MSEEGRPRRDIPRVNYVEPGDNPDESALDSSDEVVDLTAASADESFASVQSRTTVVDSLNDNEFLAFVQSHTTVPHNRSGPILLLQNRF